MKSETKGGMTVPIIGELYEHMEVMAKFVLEAHDQLHTASRQSCGNSACKIAYSVLQLSTESRGNRHESILPTRTISKEER